MVTAGRVGLVFSACFLGVLAMGAIALRDGYPMKYWAQQKVREALLDPDSGRFEGVMYYPQTKSTCGYVNAKNRMAGYAGFRPFIVDADADVRFGPPEPDSEDLQKRLEQLEKSLAFLKEKTLYCPD